MQRLSPGVDTERFYPGCGGAEVRERLGIPADAPVVVCTARMIKRKGQDTLVRVWSAVLAEIPAARLLLVGDGPNRRAVERLSVRLGVSDSVIFVGGVQWDEVPAYTDAGDVFAMPCRTRLLGLEPEAFGIVFLEAQACGAPVIIGASGGAPEALHGPDTGEVVDSSDCRAIAAALIRRLQLRQSRAARTNGLSREVAWEAVAARLLQYQQKSP
jgi:phosphatidylinositol alpha-1,6-mannosyltransferase